jgi:hypothetical protein
MRAPCAWTLRSVIEGQIIGKLWTTVLAVVVLLLALRR